MELEKEKEHFVAKNPQYYEPIKDAFYFNHLWMSITVVITIITAILLKVPIYRYIILMETAISTISSTIYYLLLQNAKHSESESKEIDWKGITVLRYNGWAFSTPLMLIAFILFLSVNTNIKISLKLVATIILLDWVMLYLGYLGEIGYMDRTVALITGFIPFFILFGIIYYTFLRNKVQVFNVFVFGLFVVFWGLYGVGYAFDLEPRNYLMNVLDLLSKSGIGIIFSVYFLSKL